MQCVESGSQQVSIALINNDDDNPAEQRDHGCQQITVSMDSASHFAQLVGYVVDLRIKLQGRL